jgi:hypothetical protein
MEPTCPMRRKMSMRLSLDGWPSASARSSWGVVIAVIAFIVCLALYKVAKPLAILRYSKNE